MDLKFTSLEKKAIAKVLIDIAIVDQKADEYEQKYLDQIQKLLEITDEELAETEYMSVAGCMKIIKGFTYEKKYATAFMMREMITVDGEVDEDELSIFFSVCDFAEFDPEDLNQ